MRSEYRRVTWICEVVKVTKPRHPHTINYIINKKNITSYITLNSVQSNKVILIEASVEQEARPPTPRSAEFAAQFEIAPAPELQPTGH